MRLGYATGEEVMRAMAEQHGLDYVNLSEVVIPPRWWNWCPSRSPGKTPSIPLAEADGKLTVIVSDPMDYDTFDKLRFILNRQIEVALAPREAHLRGHQPPLRPDGRRECRLDAARVHRYGHRLHRDRCKRPNGGEEEVDESSAPVVRLVQLIITEAVQLRASDIHIEPFEDRIRVRYRIDGVLVERDSPPRRLLGAILSRIKILVQTRHCRASADPRRPHQGHAWAKRNWTFG